MLSLGSNTLPDELAQVLAQARQWHTLGRLPEAEQAYRRVLTLPAAPPLAFHGLGALLSRRDACEEALPLLRRAVEMQPTEPDFWLDYAATFLLAGQADEAQYILNLASQQGIDGERFGVVAERVATAFTVSPDLAGIRERFKQAEAAGDYSAVEIYIREQLERFGPRSVLLQRLGTVLLRQQRNAEALEALNVALQAPKPDVVNLHNQRGIVLKRLGRYEEAWQTLTQAHDQAPDNVGIWVNLGDCLNEMGRREEAAQWLTRALQAAPQLQEARVNLASSYLGLERYDEARQLLEQALAAGYRSVAARLGLAEAWMHLGRSSEALALTREVATTAPDNFDVLSLLYRLLQSAGAMEEAVSVGERLLALQPEAPRNLSCALFNLHHQPHAPATLVSLARRFGAAVRVEQVFSQWQRSSLAGQAQRRLRLGLVSGDFVAHPVSWFLEGVLEQLAQKGTFELHAYATRPREDAVTARLKPWFRTWHKVTGLSDAALAQQIHADEIDILIDLSGHTEHHRLPMFTWRPAPLQISWLGWWATTGLKEIDYVIADKTGVPPKYRDQFVERVAWMPETRLCFTPPAEALPLAPAPALSHGHITFGCFHRLPKLSGDTLRLWAKVLAALPEARLHVQTKGLQDTALRQEVAQRFAAHGLPLERITFAGPLPRDQYLAAYAQVDVVLDTFPYTGGTTTCEALWMGVPTLTMAGDSLLSRQGASLMRAAGLPEWIATSEEEFVSKACAMAGDLPRLGALRAGLRDRLLASPLFDARRFARDFESLLLSLWRKTGLPRLAKQRPVAATEGKISHPQKGKALSSARPDQAAQRAEAINAEFAACVTLYQQGQSAEVLPRIRALVEQLPQSAPVWKVLGAVLSAVGQKQEALAAKRRAVELDPNDPDAQANLGNSLQDEDLLEEAEAHCRAALQVNPQHDNALNNLGLVLYRQGRYREALDVLQQALEYSPDFAEAMVNLGNVRRDLGDKDEAEQLYRRAIRLAPRLVNAHMNLGVLLGEGKNTPIEQRPAELAEAEARYQQALDLDPNHVETLHGLGNLYREMRRFKRAEECFQRAVELNPSHARAWLGLGGIKSYAKGSLHEAIDCFEEALRLDPSMTTVRSSLLFNHAYMGDTEPAEHLRQARLFGADVTRLAQPYTDWQTAAPPPLKIGLIGGDFRNHPVGFFLENLLRHLDRQRLEVHVYCNNEKSDDMTETLKTLVPHWTEVYGVHNRVVAKTIHEQGIHVLIELAGHTGDNRLSLFPWRPAPVQVAWLGYFATTGVAEMDWIIADRVGVPPEHQWHFCEKVWYAPDTRLCFSPPKDAPPVATLPAQRNGYVTFGCVQNLTKINDYTLHVWKRVFDAVPQARMRIQAPQFADMKAKDDFQMRLANLGFDTLRITLLPPAKRVEYLEKMGDVDFMLDTFPYPGGTTTCEALWMGVPTLTMAGSTLLGRQGASLLIAGGLPDWVANDEDEYVSKAIAFASGITALVQLRSGLRAQVQQSSLFDAQRFARNFEAALYGMWDEFCQRRVAA